MSPPDVRALLRGVLALSTLIGFSACPPTPYCAGGGAYSARYPKPAGADTPLGYVGKELAVDVAYPAAGGCGTANDEKTYTATAEVVDPKNAVVPSQVSVDTNSVAHVRFTPASPGPFHISVRFSPGDTLVQADAIVARDVTGTARVVDADCQSTVEVLNDKTLLCGLDVYRLTDKLMSLQPQTLAKASTDVLWTIFSGEVTRFRDLGGAGLTMDPGVAATESSVVRALLATPDQLWVLDSGLTHYTAGADAVTDVGSGVVADGAASILLVHGTSQAVITSDSGQQHLIACPYSSADTGISQASGDCITIAGVAIGTEPDGVWAYQDDVGTSAPGSGAYGSGSGTLALWSLTDQGLVQIAKTHLQLPLTLGPYTASETSIDGPPVLYYGSYNSYGYVASDGGYAQSSAPVLVPRVEGGDIVYDYVGQNELVPVHARGRVAWMLVSSSPAQTRIFTRTP